MARNGQPQTAAERQRAYRERRRGAPANDAVLPVAEQTPPEPPDEPPENPEAVNYALWMLESLHKAVEAAGGQRFLNKYMAATPGGGLKLYRDFAQIHARNDAPAAIEIHVQQLVIGNAMPTPGVLHSNVPGHIAGQRVLVGPGEVVDG